MPCRSPANNRANRHRRVVSTARTRCSGDALWPDDNLANAEPVATTMKNGFRVYDVDPHINPGAEVLDKYVDPSFRPRLPELAPYKVAIQSREEGGGKRHIYRFDEKTYERTLGEA